MSEYRMGLSVQGKTIWVNQCCFCDKLRITDECSCNLGLPSANTCAQFRKCPSITGRVSALIDRLPDGYGKVK